jgi:hypothetical protein
MHMFQNFAKSHRGSNNHAYMLQRLKLDSFIGKGTVIWSNAVMWGTALKLEIFVGYQLDLVDRG